MSCYVPVIFHSSLYLSLLGALEQVDGWMLSYINSGWSSHWAVGDYLYKNRKMSHCPYQCHFSQFILFIGLVVTLDFECDLCLLFVLKERWLVLISRVSVLNTLPVQLLICPLFFSTLPLSILLFLTSVSILMHCFPTEFVHLIKRLTH